MKVAIPWGWVKGSVGANFCLTHTASSTPSEIVDHIVHIAETVAGEIDLLLKFPVIKTGSESLLLHNNFAAPKELNRRNINFLNC